MTRLSNIERVVMRRVRTIRVMRYVASTTTLSALVCVATLWGIGREVWVARVFENMPSIGLVAQYNFWLSAFVNTDISVVLLVVAALLSVAYLARSVANATVSAFARPRLTFR